MAHAAPASNSVATAPALAPLLQRIARGEIPGIHGLIVAQRGDVLAEWYGHGEDETIGAALGDVHFTPDTLHDVRSVTKSVVSLLFGIAVAEGAIKDLDAPVLDWFPEYKDLQTPERRRIRVRDVLSMTSGLHWDEWSRPYTDPLNSEIAMDIAADSYRYVLSQQIDTAPGTRWSYSGGDVALVGGIIARAVHMPLETYAQQKLFGPLGIHFTWSANRGIARAASGLRLTPRAMLKLGELVRANGNWHGQQLVPAAWIETSTQRHADIPGNDTPGNAYGYLWWKRTNGEAPWFGGVGNGGQRIWIVPSRDLVIVITAGLYNSPTQGRAPAEILAAVLDATK